MSISETIREWLTTPILNKMEAHMSALDDKITAIQTAVAQLGTDLTKAIADLKAGQTPTAAQLAALDAIATQLTTLDTQAQAE